MKYLILAITIALIGCSDDNSSITGTTIHVIDNNGRAVEELKSPFEWCAEEFPLPVKNSYNGNIKGYVDCHTPVNKETYEEIFNVECKVWGACNPNGMI